MSKKSCVQSVVNIIYTTALGVAISACGGGESSDAPPPTQPNPSQPTPPISNNETQENRPTYNIDRRKTEWNILRYESPLDNSKHVVLSSSNLSGVALNIHCSNGLKNYYIKTDFITRSGHVSYRIGSNPVVSEFWAEGSGFRHLYPPSIGVKPYSIYQQLYRSRDVVFEVGRYGGGRISHPFRASGFPAAVDATREECGWSEEHFPARNGWSAEIPDKSDNMVNPNYFNSNSQFGFSAWRQYDASGKAFLMVRVGEDLSLCKGSLKISDKSFYVKQDGKEVDAVPGFSFYASCEQETPFTLILQGNFDPARPLTIATYTIQREPMAELYLP